MFRGEYLMEEKSGRKGKKWVGRAILLNWTWWWWWWVGSGGRLTVG
jgi:hypothetical protein